MPSRFNKNNGECIENVIWRAAPVVHRGERMPVVLVGTTRRLHTWCGLSLERPSVQGLNNPFWVEDEVMRKYMTAFLKVAGLGQLDVRNVIKPNLCHRDVIVTVDETFMNLDKQQKAAKLKDVDGLITHLDSVALVVRGADCPPVMIYDPIEHVVGICHCGWRGTAKKLPNKVLAQLRDRYGTKTENVFVRIGPAVCSYEYRSDMEGPFSETYSSAEINTFAPLFQGRRELNIPEAITIGLCNDGVLRHNIIKSQYSTHSQSDESHLEGVLNAQPIFFSAVRVGGDVNKTDSNVFLTSLFRSCP